MGVKAMEPMVEIFLEETSAIIAEMKEHVEEGREKNAFGREQVEDIFRNVHTLKADAAMMLYENIAKPAKELEQVLYFYRNETGFVTDVEGFLKLIDENINFYEGEIEKLIQGERMDGDSTELSEHILAYVAKMKGEEVQKQVPLEKQTEEVPDDEEEEQFFYISSDNGDGGWNKKEDSLDDTGISEDIHGKAVLKNRQAGKADKGGTAKRIKKENELFVPGTTRQKHPKHILIAAEEMDTLDNINLRLLKFANTMNPEAQSLLLELDTWLWRVHSTDFTLMAAKLDMTVKDMLRHMDKQVEFHVNGSEITIEKTKIDQISNAMIHLVRNAVDHGIEPPEERRKCGKTAKGYVNVDIEWMRDHSGISIRISDDGRGLDRNQILDKAEQKGILKKPREEYSEIEAFELIFEPGFTTREKAGEYSGMGVGMDVVRHSLEEIGGTIRIESVLGAGTAFIMEFAYDTNIGNDDRAKRRALIDESINSRR